MSGVASRMVTVACALAVFMTARAWSQAFDVVSIKPAGPDESGLHWNRGDAMTTINNYPLQYLLMRAYNLKATSQVINLPPWADKDRFDLQAKYAAEDFARMDKLPREEKAAVYRTSLQVLLADRFGLQGTLESRRMPRFALERMSPSQLGPGLTQMPVGPDGKLVGGRNSSRVSSRDAAAFMDVSGITMADLADLLSGQHETGERIVVDRTGLTGFFKFHLDYAPDRGLGISPEATLPGLLDAVRQQLGLKLVKDEGNVPVYVVKAAHKPEAD